jgi:hypothetical protein
MRTPRIQTMIVAASLLLFAASTMRAQEEKKQAWWETLSINGFISSGYSMNFNRSDSLRNYFHVFDLEDQTFKIDVLEFSVRCDAVKPGETGFRFDLTAGSTVPRVARSSGLDIGDLDFHQMFFSYVAPVGTGLRFDVGKFVTMMGYEVIEGYDGFNDNYTHSFLFGYAIPFTHTGLRALYAFSGDLSVALMVVNGWDNAVDNNKGKSLSGEVTAVPVEGLTLAGGFCAGPEQSGNSSNGRTILDLVAMYAVSPWITVGLNADRGSEDHAALDGGQAVWQGIAAYCRVRVSDGVSICARTEQFEDRGGSRTGISQRLRETTVTPEWRIAEHLVLRADLRVDGSDKIVFPKGSGWADAQRTLGVNVVYVF